MYLLGGFLYVSVLLTNAIAILSEDRFLARIGLSTATQEPAFQNGGVGGGAGESSIKAKIINLIASVRTLMRMYELVLG